MNGDRRTKGWWNGWQDKQTGEATDRGRGVTRLPGGEVWARLQEYGDDCRRARSVNWTLSSDGHVWGDCSNLGARAQGRIGAHALGCMRDCALSSISITNVFWWGRTEVSGRELRGKEGSSAVKTHTVLLLKHRRSPPDPCFMSSMPLWTSASLPLCSRRCLRSTPTQRDKLKKYFSWRCIPNVEIRLPDLNKVVAFAPSFWQSQKHKRRLPGNSFAQVQKRSLIMNTKSESEKRLTFQMLCALPCLSASPFITAFSLSFHCRLLCQRNYEPRLRRG